VRAPAAARREAGRQWRSLRPYQTALPLLLRQSPPPVGDPGQGEKKVRQTVQVSHDNRRNSLVTGHVNNTSLGATADRARKVKRRRLGRPARHDEVLERLEFGVPVVYRLFQLADSPFVQARLLELRLHLLAVRGRE